MHIIVKHGAKQCRIEVPDEGCTLGELKQLIADATGVLPALQKLFGKPNLQSQSGDVLIKELGIVNKTALMLIGSSAQDVLSANALSGAEKEKEIERGRILHSLPFHFWLLPSFAGLLGDPYVAGRGYPLEGGSALLALLSLDIILSRINTLGAATAASSAATVQLLQALGKDGTAMVSHRLLKDMPLEHRTAFQKAHSVVRACYDFTATASKAVDSRSVLDVVQLCVQAVDRLPLGEWLLMPSGWLGLKAYNIMFMLIHNSGQGMYSVVVVNRGTEGQAYHPQWQTADKVISCPVLRFDRIGKGRLTDKTFWLLLLSLWMRKNDPQNQSEFIREEVFYDVLLPWLVEKAPLSAKTNRYATEMLLHETVVPTDDDGGGGGGGCTTTTESGSYFTSASSLNNRFAAEVVNHGASMLCSSSSAIKSLVTAFCYLLQQYTELSKKDLKRVKYVLKYEFFMRAAEDLGVLATRFIADSRVVPLATPTLALLAPQQETRLIKALDGLKGAGVDGANSLPQLSELLAEARKNGVLLQTARKVVLREDHFIGKIVLVYFGSLGVQGGKKFATLLGECAPQIERAATKAGAPGLELLFLSCDASDAEYEEHADLLPFPRSTRPCGELARFMDIYNIPSVLVFNAKGQLLNRHGVRAVREDPEASQFPYGQWIGALPLTATDVRMLRTGCAQVAHHTKKRVDSGDLEQDTVEHVVSLLHAVDDVVDALPKDDVHTLARAAERTDQETSEKGEVTNSLETVLHTPFQLEGCNFNNTDLLPTAQTAGYYGQVFKFSVPVLEDICSVRMAGSYKELKTVLLKGKSVVEALWERARHSGTASRVAVQMHIIESITWLFSTAVPVPLPPGVGASGAPVEERPTVASFYCEDSFEIDDGDAQMVMLEAVYSLTLSYANAWQAVEAPTRSFDAERCLIAMHMLLVFDAIARHKDGSKQCLLMASLLCSDGGYYPSTTLGKAAMPFVRVAATLELTRPHLLPLRSALLGFIQHQQNHLARELFDLRMPDKLELRKGSYTIEFLRSFLANAGYALDEPGSMMGKGSEMELLMEWICSNRSPLAVHHREFIIYRDMVLLTKFLGTMEMRDAQLLYRRKESDAFASWRVAFEEDAPGRQMSAGWRTRPAALRWECVMVRGRDMDIADVIVKGFGDREVMYGEGLVLQSPIDVSRLLEVEHAMEDDVLHAKSLPTFGGAMSTEESEVLLSCLTAPYVRIPLILDFLSSQGRHTYLFAPEVQEVVRAVLFEPASFVSPEQLETADPRNVPMRLDRQQQKEVELRNLRGDFSKRNEEAYLGTTYGLLLNDITNSPTAVLSPLQRILESVAELGPSSVYSSNASYVLFVVGLICDILAFCRFIHERHLTSQMYLVEAYHNRYLEFLEASVRPLLLEWLRESETNTDTPTQCVLYAYEAMINRALWKGEAIRGGGSEGHGTSMLNLLHFLQSCAFVRARHGFGMGMQRTQLTSQEGDQLLTPEEKMLRFLQSQGLDTSRVTNDMLLHGKQLMMSGGRRRAVFVQISSRQHTDTVRVPNLFRSDPTSTTECKSLKLPPADVPENVLFCDLLEEHLYITAFLDSLTAAKRSAIMHSIAHCVMRDRKDKDHHKERSDGSGDSPGSPKGISSWVSDQCLDDMNSEEEEWSITAPGIYKGPAKSGLLFHAQTCELFWQNDELKPVPDSMSHFTDYENILGKDILQCGLVSRYQHRHWVHIVGTPYDVIEWTAPNGNDQGVHCPIAIGGYQPGEMVKCAVFEGITYDRLVTIGDEDPWPERRERWAVEMIRQVLFAAYSGVMKYFPLAPALETSGDMRGDGVTGEGDLEEMRFITNDAPQYENEGDLSTWKEIVAFRYPQPHFVVFNLVPHARRLFRSLVFSTNQRYCLHSLALQWGARKRESLQMTAFQAGEIKRRVQFESTLEIHRYNESISGREVYVPARLLQGLIPSVLLESFFFWQGTDDVLRGYPLSDESGVASVTNDATVTDTGKSKLAQPEGIDHWFNYGVEIFLQGSRCTVVRRNSKHYSTIVPVTKKRSRQVDDAVPLDEVPPGRTGSRRLLRCASSTNSLASDEETSAPASNQKAALLQAALPHLPLGVCAEVLQRVDGDTTKAIKWAGQAENQLAMRALLQHEREVSSKEEPSGEGSDHHLGRRVLEESLGTEDWVLLNLLQCRQLSQLIQLLTNLEDCSHILVWACTTAASWVPGENEQAIHIEDTSGRFLRIQTIELPRLRTKFYIGTDGASARWRLFLADQPGWRIAESDDFTAERMAHVRRLRHPFQQCLVLCNRAQEVALMVPNHDFVRVDVESDPFNSLLLFDRSSLQWREAVPSPFYLYLVHSSNAFVVPPTLSASLYYAVMQCATQHYAGALRTLESCYTDTVFTTEEAFVFSLFERTVTDLSPDAHAVHLKLAHAVQYSPNTYQWSLPDKVAGYLKRKRHVSSDCQLKRSEILDLMQRCATAPPLVRAQLELYAALMKQQRQRLTVEDVDASFLSLGTQDVLMKTPTMERCGFPWERLLLYPWSKISPQRLKRFAYKAPPPGALAEEKLVEFLWSDDLLMDEEGGSTRHLGFYFLYSMKMGHVKPKLFGQCVDESLSQLLGRWFHLRHARWGRQTQGEGESEAMPSWCATVLQLMDLFPSESWPAVAASNERFAMARGINLTLSGNGGTEDDGRLSQRTELPKHFIAIDNTARTIFNSDGKGETVRNERRRSKRHTPCSRGRRVHMKDHIQGRILSCDTSRASIRLNEDMLAECYFNAGAGGRRRTLQALCTEPLSELISAGNLITQTIPLYANTNEEQHDARMVATSGQLPFQLNTHPLAQTPLAQDMLRRLEADCACFEEQQRGRGEYIFSCLSDDAVRIILSSTATHETCHILAVAETALRQCEDELSELSQRDATMTTMLAGSIHSLANDVCVNRCCHSTEQDLMEHHLHTFTRSRSPVTMEWLCGGLLSTTLKDDLDAVNPFHGDFDRLQAELVLFMLLSNRGFFAQQAKLAVNNVLLFLELCRSIRGVDASMQSAPTDDTLQKRIEELVLHCSIDIEPDVVRDIMKQPRDPNALLVLPSRVSNMMHDRFQQLMRAALDLLKSKRHFVTLTSSNQTSPLTICLDPRFLIFEFMFNILLRARQVEMVRWFAENVAKGQSRVQQMIMGQGKTTVVGPLLALLLADGKQLVTQVMPTALLEQTRDILRRCFSVVLVKHVYTLQVDRSFDDRAENGGVELLHQKLKAAEASRSVVIAAPECIKSLFLKWVEQMHVIENIPTEDLTQECCVDERHVTHATTLMKRTMERSAMADAITPILDIWQRGVLIMDEVDVLLHPLRSELNFPIGLKYPIDVSGPRWLLPIHLLDAIFCFQCGRACEPMRQLMRLSLPSAATSTGNSASDVAMRRVCDEAQLCIHAVIARGFEKRALQREPHLVLLDSTYYETELLPALVPWIQVFLYETITEHQSTEERIRFAIRDFASFQGQTSPFLLSSTKEDGATSATVSFLNANLSSFGIQLLNLAHSWLHSLLPHVLSKIDRVSFGVLQPHDLLTTASKAETMPFGRRMMAVPFIAKDVPSRSSEFAHPDVVVGLTILAFRYEGLRLADVKELITQLKQDFSRQAGPKEHRPAAKLYRHWLRLASADRRLPAPHQHPAVSGNRPSEETLATATSLFERAGVPLFQLQLTDKAQMASLHAILHRVPEVVHYYLCSCVFPRTTNFQQLKLSACGHELGSSMLFAKRIGFSGTPSNLLPLDLGECFYEPGSDGSVLSVLTNPHVVQAEVLPDSWTPLKVLDLVATAQPPYHALIDAGALITNMDNSEVASYLLARLPASLFDGVVFLDARDRQMMLQRDNGLIVPIAQCGVTLSRRFTFFDQVHTTGTDVKQCSTATAAITLGKDMVFRDYAQGSYRMRGIGKGQRLCLYLIPEVVSRIHDTLTCEFRSNDLLRDVPAWLLLNSMRMEGLQFFKLSLQELANVWRKRALENLIVDSRFGHTHRELMSNFTRCRRFHLPRPVVEGVTASLPDLPLLKCSIQEFRETVGYPVEESIRPPKPFLEKMVEAIAQKPLELTAGDEGSQHLVGELVERMRRTVQAAKEANTNRSSTDVEAAHAAMDFNAEVVHEQEAEEQQEQEQQQEEQRISVYSRDDEFQVPWSVETLRRCGGQGDGSPPSIHGCCFYQIGEFQIRPSQPHLNVDSRYFLSDNYFRLKWHGVGERRLKNTLLFLEWLPLDTVLVSDLDGDRSAAICSGVVTLAEGESLRWMMHHSKHIRETMSIALRIVSSGQYMDATSIFSTMIPRSLYATERLPTLPGTLSEDDEWQLTQLPISVESDGAALLYRFLNNEMFFSSRQLTVLEKVLERVSPEERLQFFVESQRVRRRHRNHWEDAPIAALFVSVENWPHLSELAAAKQMELLFDEMLQLFLRAAKPMAPPNLRKEAETAMRQLELFEKSVTAVSNSAAHGEADEEDVRLPVKDVVVIMMDAFEKQLKTLNNYAIEQALLYVLSQHSRKQGKEDLTDVYVQPMNGFISLGSLYEFFPVLNRNSLYVRIAEARDSANPSADDRATRLAETWACPACTVINEPSSRVCVVCLATRPAQVEDGSHKDIAAMDDEESVDGSWSCPLCTFINDTRTREHCSMCLGRNPSPLLQKGVTTVDGLGISWECPEGYWVCAVEHGGCSKFNPNTLFYCQVCEKARPNLATVRF